MENISHPSCVASTGDAFCRSIAECDSAWSDQTRNYVRDGGAQSNLFRQAKFSADGATIVTHSEDQCLRTFVLADDLLDETRHPHTLSTAATLRSSSALQSYTLHPHFSLEDSNTTLVLSSSRDQPLSLTNALDYGRVHATYSLITRESHVAATSLTWTPDAMYFVCGSKNQISLFDCSRDGSAPVMAKRTSVGKSGEKIYGRNGLDCRGIISTLSIRADSLLAAGTTEREIGLYDLLGHGKCVATFSLVPSAGEHDVCKGTGIMNVAWSPCENYLLVAERQSDTLQVFDIRNMRGRIAWLCGRKANTTQRLSFDVIPAPLAGAYQVWAGGTDGCVRMWQNPGLLCGEQEPYIELKMHHDPVSSVCWHPFDTLLATCSGRRFASIDSIGSSRHSNSQVSDDSEDQNEYEYASRPSPISELTPDNTLKLWSI